MNHRTFSIASPTGPDTRCRDPRRDQRRDFRRRPGRRGLLAVCGAPVAGAATPAAVVALSFIQE
jgi:hypothetical protein